MEDLHVHDGVERARRPARCDESVERDTPQLQLLAWISPSSRITNLMASGVTEVLPLFWIRLYGVLADIADFVELTMDDLDDRSCMFPLARAGSDTGPIRRTIAVLKALYTNDELLYIEYRRHVECHPMQSKYRSRRQRSGLPGHVPSALLDGAQVTVAEAEAAFHRLHLRYEFDDDRIGVAFARKAVFPMRELEAVTKACFFRVG